MPKLIPKQGAATVIEMRTGRYLLGSASDADFPLDHPSVAERHCEIEVTDDAMTVSDLGSLSGTYVNGKVVESGTRVDSGQRLRVGDVEFEVQGAPARIVVPQVSALDKLEAVEMADGYMSCSRHRSERGLAQCMKCDRIWCIHCLHTIALQGKQPLKLCPECGATCGPVKKRPKPRQKTFWERLMDFLFGWMRPKKVRKVKRPGSSNGGNAQASTGLKIKKR